MVILSSDMLLVELSKSELSNSEFSDVEKSVSVESE